MKFANLASLVIVLCLAASAAFAASAAPASPLITTKTVTLISGVVVDVPSCWNVFQDDSGARITPNFQQCTEVADAVEFRITKLPNSVIAATEGKLTRILAKPRDKKAFNKCATSNERSLKGKRMAINCGPGPDSVTFTAYLKCKGQIFEIFARDQIEGYNKTDLGSPAELPDRIYRTAFNTLRCK